jgi:hypothetical protein
VGLQPAPAPAPRSGKYHYTVLQLSNTRRTFTLPDSFVNIDASKVEDRFNFTIEEFVAEGHFGHLSANGREDLHRNLWFVSLSLRRLRRCARRLNGGSRMPLCLKDARLIVSVSSWLVARRARHGKCRGRLLLLFLLLVASYYASE